MKKQYWAIAFVLLCCAAASAQVGRLQVGTKFQTGKVFKQKTPSGNTLVAFMPSLTYDTEYASMMTQSFYYYFDQRLAFEGLPKRPGTRIVLVVNDKDDQKKSTQNILGGMTVIYDETGEMFSSFGVKPPENKNADSTVVLIDGDDKIVFVDAAYRSQGEHLKPLENKVKELDGIPSNVRTKETRKPLQIGRKAPDFRINKNEKLSDLRGTVVLLTFYPAAFSGMLPRPYSPGDLLDVSTIGFSPINMEAVSCIAQIRSFDKPAKTKKKSRRIAISASTELLLQKWKELLGTHNIEYANDPDYSISSSYFAYNPNGYNNRVSIIVDQDGRIAHIDSDYSFSDEIELMNKMDELVNKDQN